MSTHYSRLLAPPAKSFFLFGPRGTGKTTLVRELWPEAARVDLLDEALYQSYLANIGLFHDELVRLPRGARVVVDEIQRLPQLLNEVHRLVEERRLCFVLLGSSARKLRQAGVNLLAGRALQRQLHPFVPAELGADFDLRQTLEVGTLPIVWDSDEQQETLRAYVQTYLKEEIQAEALVRNLPGFVRFMPVAALFHGQVVNTASIARDAEVARTTVEGFFSILEETLLGFWLPAFETKLRVRERKKPKFYFVDPGLVRAIKHQTGTVSPEERGHLFEGWLVQLLRAHNDYHGLYDEAAYWAPAEARQVEVDLVLSRGRERIAIEIKGKPTLAGRDLAGLKAIADLPGLKRRIAVYTGPRQQQRDGIEVWPVATLLEQLERRKF